MTVLPQPPSSPLSPPIRAALDGLRAAIRRYVWSDGLAAAAVCLAIAFWASLALDWFFEPAPAVRAGLLLAVAVLLASVVHRLIVRRSATAFSDANLALLIERRYPHFQETLLTSVELARRSPDDDSSGWRRQMLDGATALAAERTAAVSLPRIFAWAPLRKRIATAALLTSAALALAVIWPAGMAAWARRNLLLSEELWPRQSRLVMDGFPDRSAKVARGGELELLVKADLHMPIVPAAVQVRYRVEGGSRSVAVMTRAGAADPSRDDYQEYTYAFRGLLYPLEFDVVGADSALRGYRIDVVESPAFVQGTQLEVAYPPYTGRKPQAIPFSGAVQLPFGSRVVVAARCNKDLTRVQVDSVIDDKPGPAQTINIPADAADRRVFRCAAPTLNKDLTLLFTLLDADGIRNREPVRLTLAAVSDESPRLTLQLRGIGSAITPQARLPVAGQVSDDFGLVRLWSELAVEGRKPAEQTLASPAGQPVELPLQTQIEVERLGVKPGERLVACVKAADAYNLAPQPNVGVSERWQLDVVTPQQLQTLLEARELGLRQRFEAVVQEVVEAREILLRMDFKADAAAPPAVAAPGVEPGERNDAATGPERLLARVDSVLQQSRKSAGETAAVAESFDDIRLQLINNRIDTAELVRRIKDGIADPLTDVAQRQFPELEQALERLRENLRQVEQAPVLRNQAREQFDRILLAMKQALARMHELESFNEVVDKLREILDEETKLQEQTKQRHKQKLRDLLQE